MNNKQNAKKSEGDISTKKGFLISLPGKKKTNETESSINFAKPAKSQNAPENNGSKPQGRNGAKHDKKAKNDVAKGISSENTAKNDKNNKNVKNNKNERPGRNDRDDNRQNQNRRDDRRAKGKNKNSAKNDDVAEKLVKESKLDNRDDNRAENRQQKRDNQQNHSQNRRDNKKGSKNDRRNDRDNRQENQKPKMAPLSALSSDIAAYAKAKSEQSQKNASVKEISLEEKFKNAKPLAEQIAEQEMRAKGIKVPYDGEKLENEEKQEIVGVRFREAGKIYYFDPDGKQVPFGTPVIVETARGSEYGFAAISNRFIPTSSLTAPLKKIERIATQTDTQKHIYNKDLEKDAEIVFKERVAKLGLPMNLIYVEYTFDNSRLLFYFTAEMRIDFRELVKELAGVFRTRIELRQIGVRDEAKSIGGLGICGRASCCSTFLGDFAQVSIKMAKDQNLSLNAAKISGACGKLMCCLRYEDRVYEEENARTPCRGSVVETPEGKGVVTESFPLKGQVSVSLENSPDTPPKTFHRDEVKTVGFNKNAAKQNDIDESELKDLE